ncbi:Solvent efflux pump periplasmic linker SrpA precursor [Roseovarius albus]|uniref:Solvent efflux pump periplasmic linker SrpA n=1 Tax=Roseovarius albus TaxID=1247867 RepID=A0A1X7A4L5_9RHOB|nr:efflux RND transporter periplasmic adaptor subunit [Roseovarius albus]SLN70101.1 Solvent efflux pump periplasmic linker SrpA precursor [Roseovarius albus]
MLKQLLSHTLHLSIAVLIFSHPNTTLAQSPIGAMPGVVEPARQWDVAFPINGHIKAIHFNEGMLIFAGDLLVELNDREASAKLEMAKINLHLAEAQYEESLSDLERYETLLERDAVPISTVNDTKLTARVAALQVESNLLNVRAAEVRLSLHQLTAPSDGVISAPQMYEGSNFIVSESHSIARISQLDPINIRARIPVAKVLARIRDGVFSMDEARELDFELRFTGGDAYEHTGTLTALGFEINAETGEGSVLISFPNPSRMLRPGTQVTVEAINPLE